MKQENLGNTGLRETEVSSLDENISYQFEQDSYSAKEARELRLKELPESHEAYTDKYFLRTNQILKAENLNPKVTAQVFLRQGPGKIAGIDSALAILEKYGDFSQEGAVYTKVEGEEFAPLESVMIIQAPVQNFVELETMYLGVIAAETTRVNEGINNQQIIDQVTEKAKAIVEAVEGRPVIYMGARHWSYDQDRAIAAAAFAGGMESCSTDIGGAVNGTAGIGTIPHALENIFAYKYGKENAVVESTLAFDRVIDPEVPRVALIDYNNREIDDAIATCRALKAAGSKLDAVRVDTCGENLAQGGIPHFNSPEMVQWKREGLPLIPPGGPDSYLNKYWLGTGVKVPGVYRLRKALDQAGFADTKIILTSGFGSLEKVKAFIDAEKVLGTKLFDGLGVGGLYKPCWTSTMDIVEVGKDYDSLESFAKEGRNFRPNPDLTLQLGGEEK